MRRYMVAGNWKMNMGPAAAATLAAEVGTRLAGRSLHGDVVVCPPFVSIPAVAGVVEGGPVQLGAQDCGAKAAGAYTGQVAAPMLAEAGCGWVIIGHSERRQYQREGDELFVDKINSAFDAGLKVIFCYGELLEERRIGREKDVVRDQLKGVLARLPRADADNLVLAYEPVWAIGTGETATPEQAQEMHAYSRHMVAEILEYGVAGNIRILYGGSCKPGNAREIIGQPDVDGGLIGGAALTADDFTGIIDGAEAAAGA
jgi:triosephosphate isomerase